jgi:arginase family enzyme
MALPSVVHFDLDGAWPDGILEIPTVPLHDLGAQLRFCTTRTWIDTYAKKVHKSGASFVLFGSGDFHHLTAAHVRQIEEPAVLVSFDNHPDWDRRPPRWQCGAWVNRALELPKIEQIHLWGCTSPDARWPGSFWANPRAIRRSRLQAHLVDPLNESEWRRSFSAFAEAISGRRVYVTVDLDCLAPEHIVTNWDAGTLSVESLVFALKKLREKCSIIGGDICGGWSEEVYARPLQRWAAGLDHPKLELPARSEIAERNERTLQRLWPAISGTTRLR